MAYDYLPSTMSKYDMDRPHEDPIRDELDGPRPLRPDPKAEVLALIFAHLDSLKESR